MGHMTSHCSVLTLTFLEAADKSASLASARSTLSTTTTTSSRQMEEELERRASVAAGAQKDQRTNSTTRTRRHSTAASMRKRPDASRKLSSLSAQMNPNIEAAFSSWKREKRRES
ncbi:unnamed protein product, partial [Mesorhabditis spiculigera]